MNKRILILLIAAVVVFIIFVPIIPYKPYDPKDDCHLMIGYPKGGGPICEAGNTTILSLLLNYNLRKAAGF